MAGSAAYSATSIVVVMAKDKGRGKGTKGGASSSSAAANKVRSIISIPSLTPSLPSYS